jgi:hypothetical protein
VAGAPDVHVKATVPLYPLVAVAIPFQVTVEFTGVEVESGFGVTAIVNFPKSRCCCRQLLRMKSAP